MDQLRNFLIKPFLRITFNSNLLAWRNFVDNFHFKENMIVNPDKSQTIIIERKCQQNNRTSIKINDININSENSVRLLGLEIDSKLNFDKHITQLSHSKKSSGELNAFCR